MFNFTKFWLYINMGTNLPEQQYIGFFQLRAEEVSLKGTEAEGFWAIFSWNPWLPQLKQFPFNKFKSLTSAKKKKKSKRQPSHPLCNTLKAILMEKVTSLYCTFL